MSGKASAKTFKELANRAGMCPATALLDPGEVLEAGGDGPAAVDVGDRSGQHRRPWGLPKRQLWECVCAGPSVGGQSLLECLLRAPWETGAYHVLVDTASALDPESLGEGFGDRLLWVPVRGTDQVLRALDLLLRDDNFALVASDLRGLSAHELRGIPPFAWYRLQRLAHQRAGGAILFSGAASVRCADRRILLSRPRGIEDLDRPRASLLGQLEASVRSYPKGQLPLSDDAVRAG